MYPKLVREEYARHSSLYIVDPGLWNKNVIVNVNAYTVEHGELHGEQSMVNFLPYILLNNWDECGSITLWYFHKKCFPTSSLNAAKHPMTLLSSAPVVFSPSKL